MQRWKSRLLVLLAIVPLVLLVGCGTQGSGTQAVPTPAAKADYEVVVDVEPASVSVPRSDPGDVNVAFIVKNTGAKPDTYSLQFQVFGVPWVPEGVPATIDVQPGEAQELSVPLTFDTSGSTPGFDVVLTAVSQTDASVKGQAACTLTFD